MCYVLGHGIYNVTSSLVRGEFQSYGEIESNRRFIVAELLNLKLMRRYLWKKYGQKCMRLLKRF